VGLELEGGARTTATDLRENLARVRDRIRRAEERAGRPLDGVRLVAVTKGVPARRVSEAIAAGVRMIGENRVREGSEKKPEVAGDAEWHLIGHLQTNKVARALETFDVVQTIDSLRLAREIDARATRGGRRVPVLVEVNVSGEGTKSGVTREGFFELLEGMAPLGGLEVRGLMTLGPLTDDEAAIRQAFARLRWLGEAAALQGLVAARERPVELSMGMSDDFEAAILEGSTMVRIGRALFGPRPAA
jgi:pyridoxal phosphate enzyme (YggS family)